ncbi:MAG: type II secretion system protein [Methylococcaceae bacterium]
MRNNLIHKSSQGFSLLEILVAFSILAISLGVLLKVFSSGVRTAIVSEEYAQAVQIADSLLAQTGVEEPLEETEKQGDVGGVYAWTVSVRLFEPELENYNMDLLPVVPYLISVVVDWQEINNNRTVELTTLRLATKKP